MSSTEEVREQICVSVHKNKNAKNAEITERKHFKGFILQFFSLRSQRSLRLCVLKGIPAVPFEAQSIRESFPYVLSQSLIINNPSETFMTNLEIVEQAYENFKQGNIPTLLEALSDDIIWKLPSSADVSFSGEFKGRAGRLQFFQNVAYQ
jgi:hypothetical protein